MTTNWKAITKAETEKKIFMKSMDKKCLVNGIEANSKIINK